MKFKNIFNFHPSVFNSKFPYEPASVLNLTYSSKSLLLAWNNPKIYEATSLSLSLYYLVYAYKKLFSSHSLFLSSTYFYFNCYLS